MAYKYFFYSTEQLKFRQEIENKMGKRFNVGYVIVNGARKPITEISLSPASRYSDAKLVAEGEATNFKYKEPGNY